MSLQKALKEIGNTIPQHQRTAFKISKKDVGWQLDHSLKVIIGVIKSLERSNPESYKWKFNFIRFLILTTSFIPRGKGKAPKRVIPPEVITKEDLESQLEKAKELLPLLDTLPSNSYFEHPYFGLLNLRSTRKFLSIHTKHHLKIVRDICKA